MTERSIESLIADLRAREYDDSGRGLLDQAASALESQAERIASLEAIIAKVRDTAARWRNGDEEYPYGESVLAIIAEAEHETA